MPSSLKDAHAGFLQQAIELSVENVRSGRGGPFGALIVREGRVISEGVNMVTANCDPTAHAEVIAIRAACNLLKDFQLKDCLVYSSCEPCPMCLGAIYWSRPMALYFAANRNDAARAGFDDSFIYSEIAASIEKRRIPSVEIGLERRLEAFELWASLHEKSEY